MNELEQALRTQQEAEARLEEAKAQTKRIALAQYAAARDACRVAGVALPPLKGERSSEKGSAAARARWASWTPEKRAAWLAAIQAGKRRKAALKANGAIQ